jgi:hypothetical protein
MRIGPSMGASIGGGACSVRLFFTASAPSEGVGTISAKRIGAISRPLPASSRADGE